MALYLNKEKLADELLEKLKEELKDAGKSWETDAYKYFRGIKYTYENKELKAKVNTYIERQSNVVIAHFEANTVALADSYGTGSLMLDDNPGLSEYRNDPKRWNPERKGKAIVGRKKGTYTDIFGQKHKTSGTLEGINIEGRKVHLSNKIKNGKKITGYYISPNYPSRAIQIADQWFYKNYLPKAYELAVKKMDFSKILLDR